MMIFEHVDFDDHERVIIINQPQVGLKAVIAIHNTVRGPAIGGCRICSYRSSHEAITDVLRLSRSMSYKTALAGLPVGGGKAVVIIDQQQAKTPALLDAFGDAVEQLQGTYITAEDIGSSVEDMHIIRRRTRYVSGLGRDGDPSPYTAQSCFVGARAAIREVFGTDSFKGFRVALQGLGHVGYRYARLLHDAGARLWVSETNPLRLAQVCTELNATPVAVDAIDSVDADIYAPCAFGAILNDSSIARLKCRIIAGAANNQLAHAAIAQNLHRKGIIYAPDFVINAGGVIKVCAQYFHWPDASVEGEIERIDATLTEIFRRSRQENRSTEDIAVEMAKKSA